MRLCASAFPILGEPTLVPSKGERIACRCLQLDDSPVLHARAVKCQRNTMIHSHSHPNTPTNQPQPASQPASQLPSHPATHPATHPTTPPTQPTNQTTKAPTCEWREHTLRHRGRHEPSFDAAVQSDGPLLDEDVARARNSGLRTWFRSPELFMVRQSVHEGAA